MRQELALLDESCLRLCRIRRPGIDNLETRESEVAQVARHQRQFVRECRRSKQAVDGGKRARPARAMSRPQPSVMRASTGSILPAKNRGRSACSQSSKARFRELSVSPSIPFRNSAIVKTER